MGGAGCVTSFGDISDRNAAGEAAFRTDGRVVGTSESGLRVVGVLALVLSGRARAGRRWWWHGVLNVVF